MHLNGENDDPSILENDNVSVCSSPDSSNQALYPVIYISGSIDESANPPAIVQHRNHVLYLRISH